MILALALAPFKRRFMLNKKEGGTPMPEEPDEKKKAADEEAETNEKLHQIDERYSVEGPGPEVTL